MLGVGVVTGLWLVRGAFGSGPPAGEDVMGHLVRVQFGLDHVIGEARLDAWFPRFMTGHQLFLINGPGFTWIVGIVQAMTLGWLTVDTAMTVVAVGSFAFTAPAAAFLARSLGISYTGSALAGLLALAVSTTRSLGLEGMFITGLIPQQTGAIFFCLALGSAIRLTSETTLRWALCTAAAGCMLLLTHLRSALAAAILFLLYALATPRKVLTTRSLKMLGVAAAATLGVTAFWILPFLAHLDLRGTITAFSPTTFADRVAEVWGGHHLLPSLLAKAGALACVVGLAVFAIANKPMLVLVWLPVALFVLGYALQEVGGLSEISVQIVDRALGYVGILFLFPLAALGGEVIARHRAWQIPAVIVVALGVAFLMRGKSGYAAPFPEAIPEMASAARTLQDTLGDTDRFVVQRDYPAEIERTGVIHPETWLVRHSGRNSLNVFNPEATPSGAWAFADSFGHEDLAVSTASLRTLGATHVIATSEPFADELRGLSDYQEVWSDQPLTLFELIPQPTLATAEGLRSGPAEGSPENFGLDVTAPEATDAIIPVSWSPKWSVSIDGGEVPAAPAGDNLLGVEVPAGDHRLEIRYGSDLWDALGAIITGLTLIGGVAAAARTSRRRDTT